VFAKLPVIDLAKDPEARRLDLEHQNGVQTADCRLAKRLEAEFAGKTVLKGKQRQFRTKKSDAAKERSDQQESDRESAETQPAT